MFTLQDYLNHYGVHPFYMVQESLDNGGYSHGVLLLNSNAQGMCVSVITVVSSLLV